MTFISSRLLFRVSYPSRYLSKILRADKDQLLDLAEIFRVDNFVAMDERRNFADVRMAWNELGIGLQASVTGKEQTPQGDVSRPRQSDGITLWIDTRDARASHRASRYCHQLHFLPAGGGPERDEPAFAQTKINRAI